MVLSRISNPLETSATTQDYQAMVINAMHLWRGVVHGATVQASGQVTILLLALWVGTLSDRD